MAVLRIVIVFLFFCAAGAAEASTLGRPANNLGLIGYWSMDEGTSTIIGDSSPNKNTGILFNGPLWASGKVGVSALNFDGSDDFASTTFSLTSTSTISFWMNADFLWSDASKYTILDFGLGAFYAHFAKGGQQCNANFLAFNWESGNDNDFGEGTDIATLAPGWHHVAFIQDYNDDEAFTIYIDGVLRTKTECLDGGLPTGGLPSPLSPMRIGDDYNNGTFAPTNGFDGKLDELRVYNRALTATEVRAVYNAGNQRVGSSQTLNQGSTLNQGLVGHWTFDGQDTINTIADKSGQNNFGYFIGGATSSAKVLGQLGQAFRFDGLNDRVEASSTSLSLTSTYSVSVWVMATTSPLNTAVTQVFGKGVNNTGSTNYLFSWSHTSATFRQACTHSVGGSYTVAAKLTSTLNANTWYFLTCTYDGTNIRAYLNGNLEATTALGAPDTGGKPLFIGSALGGGIALQFFEGKIDDLRVYNRPLSVAEVKQLYQLGGQKSNASSQTLTQGTSLNQGLIDHWTFDGADTTTTIADKSGAGRNGYFFGSATSSAKTIGKMGQALNFNGSTNQIKQFPTIISAVNSNRTACAWIKSNSTARQGVVSNRPNAAGWSLVINRTTVGNLTYINDTNVVEVAGGITTGSWFHICASYNSSTLGVVLYVNGSSVTSGTIASVDTDPATTGIIGMEASNFFSGAIDDVRVYNRVLTAAEVKQLYNLGK